MYIMSVHNVNTTSTIFTGVLYCIYSYMFWPHYLAIFRLSVRCSYIVPLYYIIEGNLGSRTPLIMNKFSEQKTSWVTNGVSSKEHTSQQQRLATSWEYWRESISCCVTFAQYTSLLVFTMPSLEFHCVLWFFIYY
jgi:hypothetical protein